MLNNGDLLKTKHLYTTLLVTGILISLALVTAYNMFNKRECIIHFAVELNDHSAAFWIALDKGWFREEGIDVDYTVFSTGLELATAMARGDVDIAIACIGPLLVIRSRGSPIKLVAMTHLHGYAIVVRDGIDCIEDLSGRTISVSGPSSPTWLLLHLIEERYGLRGLDVRKMPPYIAVNALLSGKIDAAVLPEHYVTLASHLSAHILLRSQDVWPSMPGSGVVVKEDFLTSRRDVVLKIVRILGRAIEYIESNFTDSARIVSKYLASDPGVMEESMSYLDYTLDINVSSIELYVDYLIHYNVVDESFDISSFIDLSFLGESRG